MDNPSIPTKKIIYNLIKMRKTLRQNLGGDKSFDTLIDALNNWDLGNKEKLNYPTLKDLVSLSGLKYDRVRNKLQQIYKKVIEMTEEKLSFTMNEVEYIFCADTDKKHLTFKVKTLPVVPRVGEQITIPFFSAHLDAHTFYVESVHHDFEEEKQIVVIVLQQGYFNPYWHFRKAQAWEEGEIDIDDLKNLNEYELKGKLRLKRYSFWRKDNF